MKTLIAGLCLVASPAFAVTAADIQAAYTARENACRGNSSSNACVKATVNAQKTSEALSREVYQSMQQRDQERQRVQQEEIWRRQVR